MLNFLVIGISGTAAITSKLHRNQFPPIPNKFEVMAAVPEIPARDI
jgi:hypothetical protein